MKNNNLNLIYNLQKYLNLKLILIFFCLNLHLLNINFIFFNSDFLYYLILLSINLYLIFKLNIKFIFFEILILNLKKRKINLKKMYKNIINIINIFTNTRNQNLLISCVICTLLLIYFSGDSNSNILLGEELDRKYQELHMGQVSHINFEIPIFINNEQKVLFENIVIQDWDSKLIGDVTFLNKKIFNDNINHYRTFFDLMYKKNFKLFELYNKFEEIEKREIKAHVNSYTYNHECFNYEYQVSLNEQAIIFFTEIDLIVENLIYNNQENLYNFKNILNCQKNFVKKETSMLKFHSTEEITFNKIKKGFFILLNVIAPHAMTFLQNFFDINKYNQDLVSPELILTNLENYFNNFLFCFFSMKKQNNNLTCEVKAEDILQLEPSNFYNYLKIKDREQNYNLNIIDYQKIFYSFYNIHIQNYFDLNFSSNDSNKNINVLFHDIIINKEKKKIKIFKNLYELINQLSFQKSLINNFDKNIDIKKKNLYLKDLNFYINNKMNKITNLLINYFTEPDTSIDLHELSNNIHEELDVLKGFKEDINWEGEDFKEEEFESHFSNNSSSSSNSY